MKIKSSENRSLRSRAWLRASGLCLLAGCQSSPSPYPKIHISRVLSGQSIEWIDRSQQPPVMHQARLAGIDAPDLAQDPWGKQAKQRLEELLKSSSAKDVTSVEFDSTEPDKYGRKLVYLWQDGRLVNEQLLKEGFVLSSMRTSNSENITSGTKYRDRFLRASQYARLMGQGIWNPDLPMRMSPSQFRKGER